MNDILEEALIKLLAKNPGLHRKVNPRVFRDKVNFSLFQKLKNNGFDLSELNHEETVKLGSIAKIDYGQFFDNFDEVLYLANKSAFFRNIEDVLNKIKAPDLTGDQQYDAIVKSLDTLKEETEVVFSKGIDETIKAEEENLFDIHEEMLTNKIPVGFCEAQLVGGISPLEVTIIAGKPSTGKTSLALSVVDFASENAGVPVKVVFFSLDMHQKYLLMRFASCLLRRTYSEIKDLTDEFRSELNTRRLKIRINSRNKIADITRYIRGQLKGFEGVKIVFIDYIQLIRTDYNLARHDEIGRIISDLKTTCFDVNAALIILSQLSRKAEGGDSMSSLRSSGSLEQDSDIILMLREHIEGNKMFLDVVKNRNGETGREVLLFRKDIYRFNKI